MFESTDQCISNCLQTDLGSHVMYRSFGLNEVDKPNAPVKRDVIVQLSTYYPDVTLNSIECTEVNGKGMWVYNADVNGQTYPLRSFEKTPESESSSTDENGMIIHIVH